MIGSSAHRQRIISGPSDGGLVKDHSDTLIQLLVTGDIPGVRRACAAGDVVPSAERALVCSLVAADPGLRLEQASRLARNTRDRQLVAITEAHLAGDTDRVVVLVRDHLADHPDSLLAAWIATHHSAGTATTGATNPQE